MTAPETITILRARGRRLAKLIARDGAIEVYDRAKHFDLYQHPLADFEALARLLALLKGIPDRAVVRGEPVGATKGVRRLVHAKNDAPATLVDVPRRWLALDIEGIPLPPDLSACDLAGCARLAIASLPTAFASARCIVQASGSHGFRPDIRLRLWFWCDRPVSGGELTRWLRGCPADPSVFRPGQLIYTAAPIFTDGVTDPLPHRLDGLDGEPLLRVPAPAALAPPPRNPASMPPIVASTRYINAVVVNAAHRIMTAPQRHPVIISECRSLARLVRAGRLTEGEMRSVVHRAAQAAGKEDAAEIEAAIAWAFAHSEGARHGA